MDNLMARANRLAGGDDCLIRGLRDEVLRLRAALSERDRTLGEAVEIMRHDYEDARLRGGILLSKTRIFIEAYDMFGGFAQYIESKAATTVPDGFVLVPVEPTSMMIDAASKKDTV